MDAEQGVEAIKIINPDEVIPIHYNDYEVFKSPLDDFKRAVEEAGLANRVKYLSHGETYNFEVTGRGRDGARAELPRRADRAHRRRAARDPYRPGGERRAARRRG